MENKLKRFETAIVLKNSCYACALLIAWQLLLVHCSHAKCEVAGCSTYNTTLTVVSSFPSREQERAAVGDSLLMLGHSFHCQALQQDGGLVTWPNLPRMNFKWRQQLVLQLLYMEPEDFSTVYLCCYCQAGPLPGSAMIGHKRRQMQKTWLLWF